MIQIVMAHPDDEIIFGWPVLKQASSILICSNDKNNTDRAWCRYRYKALEEVGQLLGIRVKSLDYPSEFYKLNARDGSLRRFMDDVVSNIDKRANSIFTHNWLGEYGHMDHLLIYQIITQSQTCLSNIMVSDIHIHKSEWVSFTPYGDAVVPYMYDTEYDVKNDLELYEKCKAIYEKYGVWTWDQPPVETCKIHHL